MISAICLLLTPVMGVGQAFPQQDAYRAELEKGRAKDEILRKVQDSTFASTDFLLCSVSSDDDMVPVSPTLSWKNLYCFTLVCNLYYSSYWRNGETVTELKRRMDEEDIKKAFTFFYKIISPDDECDIEWKEGADGSESGIEIQKMENLWVPDLKGKPSESYYKVILKRKGDGKMDGFSPYFIINALDVRYGYEFFNAESDGRTLLQCVYDFMSYMWSVGIFHEYIDKFHGGVSCP